MQSKFMNQHYLQLVTLRSAHDVFRGDVDEAEAVCNIAHIFTFTYFFLIDGILRISVTVVSCRVVSGPTPNFHSSFLHHTLQKLWEGEEAQKKKKK